METVLDDIARGDEEPGRRADRVLLRLGPARRPAAPGHRAGRHRRQGAGHLPGARRPTAPRRGIVPAGRQATAPTSSAPTTVPGRGSAPTSPTTCRPTSSRSRRRRSCWPTRPARRSTSACTRRPACRSSPRTVASAPTSPRSSPRTRPRAPKAAHRLAVQVDVPRHRHPRRRGEADLAAAHRRRGRGRRGDHRAERPLRAVPQEGHRLALAAPARTRSSASPSRRR